MKTLRMSWPAGRSLKLRLREALTSESLFPGVLEIPAAVKVAADASRAGGLDTAYDGYVTLGGGHPWRDNALRHCV